MGGRAWNGHRNDAAIMRLPSLLSLLAVSSLAVASLGTAGCSVKIGDKTDGDNGTLSFAYQGLDDCFLGCGLDRSALEGSQVSVFARGGDANVAKTARIVEPSIARVSSQTPSCTCDTSTRNESTSTTVDPSATCPSGATKSCRLDIEIETTAAGDAHLEVVDPKGVLIDRVTMHVRAAARIDVTVNGAAVADSQPTTVRVGQKVKLETHAFDASGAEELFMAHGIGHDYGDKTILGPDASVIIGSTTIEDMIANAPGDTTVKVRASGAEQLVRFHVVEP